MAPSMIWRSRSPGASRSFTGAGPGAAVGRFALISKSHHALVDGIDVGEFFEQLQERFGQQPLPR